MDCHSFTSSPAERRSGGRFGLGHELLRRELEEAAVRDRRERLRGRGEQMLGRLDLDAKKCAKQWLCRCECTLLQYS